MKNVVSRFIEMQRKKFSFVHQIQSIFENLFETGCWNVAFNYSPFCLSLLRTGIANMHLTREKYFGRQKVLCWWIVRKQLLSSKVCLEDNFLDFIKVYNLYYLWPRNFLFRFYGRVRFTYKNKVTCKDISLL